MKADGYSSGQDRSYGSDGQDRSYGSDGLGRSYGDGGQDRSHGGQGRNYSSDSGYSGGGQCIGCSSGSSGYRGARKETRSLPGDYDRTARSDHARSWRTDYTRPQRQWDDAESPAYQELKAQLAEYYRKGVKVSLGGVRMPVWKIAQICAVREEGKYMGDYIIDEAGELIEVRFDRVSR